MPEGKGLRGLTGGQGGVQAGSKEASVLARRASRSVSRGARETCTHGHTVEQISLYKGVTGESEGKGSRSATGRGCKMRGKKRVCT